MNPSYRTLVLHCTGFRYAHRGATQSAISACLYSRAKILFDGSGDHGPPSIAFIFRVEKDRLDEVLERLKALPTELGLAPGCVSIGFVQVIEENQQCT